MSRKLRARQAMAVVELLEVRKLLSVSLGILSVNEYPINYASNPALGMTDGTISGPIPLTSGVALHLRAVDTYNASSPTFNATGNASSFTSPSNPGNTHFTWNFGDPGSESNTVVGYNAAHVYDYAGTGTMVYTATLTAVDQAGVVSTESVTVDVTDTLIGESGPDVLTPSASYNSGIIYVNSATGSDSSTNPHSQSTPFKTFGRAINFAEGTSYNQASPTLTDQNIRLARGTSAYYNVSSADWLGTTEAGRAVFDNVLIGAYGSGSEPVLNEVVSPVTGLADLRYLIGIADNSQNVTVQDLGFTSSTTDQTYHNANGNAMSIFGNCITVRRCDILGDFNEDYYMHDSGYGDSTNGVLLQSDSDHGNWVNQYELSDFSNVDDMVILDNSFTGSSLKAGNTGALPAQDLLRLATLTGAGQREVFEDNYCAPADDAGGTAVTFRSTNGFVSIADNIIGNSGGSALIVNVGDSVGGATLDDNIWVNFEDNRFIGSDIRLGGDDDEVTVRGNVMERFGSAGGPDVFFTDSSGSHATYINLVGNTFTYIGSGAAQGQSIMYVTDPSDSHFTFIDNLQTASGEGHYEDVFLAYESVSQVDLDYGNVFADATGNGGGTIINAGSTSYNASQWNAVRPNGGGTYAAYNDSSSTVTINQDASASSFSPTATYPLYAVNSSGGQIGFPAAGDANDFYGAYRPPGLTITAGAVQTVGTPTAAAALPTGWSDTDIGAVNLSGSATYGPTNNGPNGTFTMTGGGADIYGTADAFNYVYQPLTGDGVIIAEVSGLSDPAAFARVGLMIRGSTAAGAQEFSMVIDANGDGQVLYRSTVNGSSSNVISGNYATSTATYLEVQRAGNTFSGYIKVGLSGTFNLIDSETISMPANALVGMAVNSHNNLAGATASMTSVAVTRNSGTNVLAANYNPNFATGSVAPWQTVTGSTTTENTNVYPGPGYAAVINSSNGGIYLNLSSGDLVVGQTYTFTGVFYTNSNTSGAVIGVTGGDSSFVALQNNWKRAQVTFTYSPLQPLIQLYIDNSGPGMSGTATTDVDNLQLVADD